METESAAADMVNLPAGQAENNNIMTDFEAINGCNRIANAYFGFKKESDSFGLFFYQDFNHEGHGVFRRGHC